MGAARFHLLSLGCAKNTVDSQSMATLLRQAGYLPEATASQAEIILVNTCGFIGPARDESLAALRALAADKRPGQLLVAAGCLSQRHGSEIVEQIPGVDGILGTQRWMEIVSVIEHLRGRTSPTARYELPQGAFPPSGQVPRAAIQGRSAYLKIADGCRRPCAFCSIPLIKGAPVSMPVETVLDQARWLQAQSVAEINLIAQDTTDYGHDLGMKDGLAFLLERMVEAVPAVDWIRVLYAYPGYVTDRLIEVMAQQEQIVPYLDIPLQHAHPATLRRMRRPANIEWVYRTVEKMRSAMPEIAIRTTFIVGYPGESEDEFAALLRFVEELRFDRVGVFEFSYEPGTASEPLGDPIAPEEKEARRGRLMELQQKISLEKNQALVGRTLKVLVEGSGDGVSLGRSYRDAPEIDGMVIIDQELPAGQFVPALITGALPYDLAGRVVAECD